MRTLLLVLLLGCGHTTKLGAGPLVDSRHGAGVEASFEIGTHLIGAKQAAEPIGVRFEASATRESVQAIVGLAFGLNLPAAGRTATQDKHGELHGWGARASFLGAGLALDSADGASLAMRGAFGLTRGAMERGSRSRAGCLGGHEKSTTCFDWQRWRFQQTGIEVASAFYMVGNGEDLDLEGWRVSAEVFRERGALTDLD